MNIVLIIICLIGFLYGIRQRNKINPFSLFFGIWLLISVAASLKLFGILEANDWTYGIMSIGSIIFFLGLLFGEKFFAARKKKFNKDAPEYELNYKVMYILAFVTIGVYLFYFGQTIIQLMNGHDLGYIRQIAQQGEMYDVPIMNMLRILVAFPFTYVIALVTPTDIFYGKKDKLLIILTIIIMVLRLLTDGSRSAIVWLLVSLVVCYFYKRKDIGAKVKKINKKLLILLFIVPVIFLIVATLSRSGSESVRFTYYYFAMEPKMFENWMEIADQSGIMGFGMAALNGFFFVIFYVITHIFPFIAAPAAYQSVYGLLEGVGTNWQTIADQGTRANSYASTFFTFYVDGRVFGVVIGMLLFGLIAGYFYRKVKVEKNNLRAISLYSFIMLGILFSFIQFPLKSPFTAVALVLLLTIVYKKKKGDKKKVNEEANKSHGGGKSKILAVSHSTAMSGANKSFISILGGLKDSYDITVLVNSRTGDLIDKLEEMKIKTAYANYNWSYAHPGKTIVKKTLRRVRDFLRYTKEFANDELSFIVEGQGFDLVYTNTSVVDVGARVANKYGLPHIWHIREFGEEDFELIPFRTQEYRNKLMRESKCLIVISEALKRKYEKISKKIKVVYNGFQIEKLSGKSVGGRKEKAYNKDEKINILMVGQVTPAKGQDIAALAVKKLVESGWKVKLILAGKFDQGYVKSITDEIGGEQEWLELLGEVKNVYELRDKADIELVCSRKEAFGRVTIEAMLHGVPVVGSNSGGTTELIEEGKTGLLFKAGNADELSKKILEILENGNLRHEMVQNAYSFADKFTVDRTIYGVKNVISMVLSEKKEIA